MKSIFYSLMALALAAPMLANACSVTDTKFKTRATVQSNIVINSDWEIVGGISGNTILNSSGKLIGSLIGQTVMNSKAAVVGHVAQPNIFNNGYQLLGYGVNCTNIELAAVKLLAL